MPNRKRYSFWINDTEAEGLKAIKADVGISESEHIRQAIRDWLEKKGVTKAERKQAARSPARSGRPVSGDLGSAARGTRGSGGRAALRQVTWRRTAPPSWCPR
jgi:hypothetical protein